MRGVIIRMKLVIEIPKEFEQDWKYDSFADSLNRLIADIHCLAGKYEKETAEMLIDAFDKAYELSCEDCISRQSAYEAVDLRIQELRTHPQFCKKHPNTSDVIDVLGVKKYIDKIQCVIPKRPTG